MAGKLAVCSGVSCDTSFLLRVMVLTPNSSVVDHTDQKSPTLLPLPVGIENIVNTSSVGSPMDITPKIALRISRDDNPMLSPRSPLKRTRLQVDWGNSISNSSPKRKTLERSNTFPSPKSPAPEISRKARNKNKGNITNFGLRASATVKNLFKTEKKKLVPVGEASTVLKASMLAMLLVHRQNFVIMETLSEASELKQLDGMMEEFYDFFNGHNQAKRLIDHFITKEILKTMSHTTLFRETSCATKLIGLVFKREVTPHFLKAKLFENHIVDISTNCDSFEIDPDRVKEGFDVEENRKNLLQKCSDILMHIHRVMPNISPKISHIMKRIHDQVSEKWTEGQARIAVNSFLFLRYICPCLVSPSSISISSNQRRALILVSKVLQSTSNRTNFEKEPFMEKLNSGLHQLRLLMDQLFETLQGVETPEMNRTKKQAEYFLAADAIQKRLVANQKCIIPALTEGNVSEFEEAISVFSTTTQTLHEKRE